MRTEYAFRVRHHDQNSTVRRRESSQAPLGAIGVERITVSELMKCIDILQAYLICVVRPELGGQG